MMVAVNDGTALQYLLTDHLGSTVAVTNSSGTLTSQQRYLPFGAARTIPNSPILGTDFGYTGQRMLDEGMGGIMDYKARFYSPYLNRFLQPDTVIPGAENSQAWNRYSYAYNNPIRYNDPDGHCPICATAVIGAAIGAIVGAVGYTAYVAATGSEFNSKHFWMATGGGAVAGALIGTGVGIAQGLTAAGATTAAIEAGTVATTANAACGGDMCISEVQDASRAFQTAGLRFTQATASPNFSLGGRFSGQTIGNVANNLRNGLYAAEDVAVNYIERGGYKLIDNTRSALSLLRSGISVDKWNLINQTGNKLIEAKITQRLIQNGLPQFGTEFIRITGLGKYISSLK
jgi:RHS repeat-associated protein